MKLLVLSFAFLALAAKKKDDPPPDPNHSISKAHGGKVWVVSEPPSAVSGEALSDWIKAHPASSGELAKKSKDGPWAMSYVAVFKKPAAKGPMTVQFVDKSDPKAVVDQYSPANDSATLVFQGIYDLDPDLGFNKGRTYLVKVGQIIKNKFQPYAVGEVTLK